MVKAKSVGPPADCTLVVAVGDGLASDVELARWTTGFGGYKEEPPLDLSGITLSRRDLEAARARGGMDLLLPSRVPLIATNLLSAQTKQPLLTPYRMFSCTGHAVAILALGQALDTPDIHSEDPVISLRTQFESMASSTDIIIVLSNAGAQVDAGIASQLRTIDVLVSGDSDPGREPETWPGTDTLLISPAYKGQSVGVADLTFDRHGKLIRHSWDRVLLALQ